MREMFSSISVPPRSLTPQRRLSVAASSPIFTQLACRFGIVRPRARRKAAVCLRFSSREISSIPWVRPSRVWKGMKLSGTNSVIPPVRSCSAAHHPHVAGQLPRLLDVAEHHRRGRAQPGAVRGLDDLHPALDRQLVGRDPLPHAVVEHLGRGARASSRGRTRAGTRRPPRARGPSARTCSGPPSASRRAGGAAARPPLRGAASAP